MSYNCYSSPIRALVSIELRAWNFFPSTSLCEIQTWTQHDIALLWPMSLKFRKLTRIWPGINVVPWLIFPQKKKKWSSWWGITWWIFLFIYLICHSTSFSAQYSQLHNVIELTKWALSPNSHPKGIGWLLISSPQHTVYFIFQSTSREHHSCTTPGTRFLRGP